MKIKITQVGKTYKIDANNKVTVTHEHDAIICINGEYYKNKYTGEWLSEQEAQDAYDVYKLEEEYANKYY